MITSPFPGQDPGSRFPEYAWQAVILGFSAAVLIITIWCLMQGISIIFMHLYYFPIVLLAYHYRWKGFGPATLLAIAYLGLVVVFSQGQPDIILGGAFRSLVFVGIAAIIAYLSEHLARAQEVLISSRQFSESVIANANVWITVLSPEGTILVWNTAAEQISGYRKEDVVGNRTIWKQLYPDNEYRMNVTRDITRIISRDMFLENYETRIRCADGSIKTIVWNTRAQRDERGTVTGYIAIGRDVTAQKAAELLAGESSRFLTAMINALPMPVFFKDREGKYLGCNALFEESIGLPRDKIIGRTVYEIAPRDLADRYAAADRSLFEKPVPQQYETQVRYADGSYHDVIFTKAPFFNQDGTTAGLIGAFLDITDRRSKEERIQKLLHVQEEQLRIINTSPAVSFLWKAGENWPVEMVSSNVAVFGYTPDDFLSGRIAYSAIIHPGDLRQVTEEVAANSANHVDDFLQEYRIYGKGGETFWIADYTHIRRTDAGVITHYEGMILDITGRKRAEEALKETNSYLTSLFDYANAPIIVWDREFRITRFNHAFEHLTGRTETEVLGRPLSLLFPETSRDVSMAQIRETLAGIRWESVEIPILHISGEIRTVLWNSATLYAEDGKTVIATIAQGQDITERNRMESAFRASRQLFMDIISFLPDPTYVIDRDGTVIAWNKALENLSGISQEEMIGKGDHEYSIWMFGRRRPVLIDLVIDPDKDAARLNYTDIRWEGKTVTAQTVITRAGSSRQKVPLSLVASPLIDAEGKITGAIESLRDISRIKEAEAELARFNANLEKIVRERTQALNDEIVQRKYAEQEVQEALRYTRSVIEANPDLMVVLDEKGIILDINTAGEKLTGVPARQLIGTHYLDYLDDDGTLKAAFSHLLSGEKREINVRIRRRDGHLTPISVHAMTIPGTGDTGGRTIVAAHDITRQKADEEVIRASLEEKIILLREIHHRVKNNLQIIISLTNLQMRKTEDPAVKQIMAETQNRVRAMSLVHEKLYRSESLSQIDFADYTRFLATQLLSFYTIDTRTVRLEFGLKKIMVDINTAVPLGLIMNELVSNALKHAFPGGRSGTLSISGGAEGGEITLIVRDDGVGMPPGTDLSTAGTLGMRLILSLVDQVDGSLNMESGQGTTFTLRLRKSTEPEEAIHGTRHEP